MQVYKNNVEKHFHKYSPGFVMKILFHVLVVFKGNADLFAINLLGERQGHTFLGVLQLVIHNGGLVRFGGVIGGGKSQ